MGLFPQSAGFLGTASSCKSHCVPPAAWPSALPKIPPAGSAFGPVLVTSRLRGREKQRPCLYLQRVTGRSFSLLLLGLGLFWAPASFPRGFPRRSDWKPSKAPPSPAGTDRRGGLADALPISPGNKDAAGAEPERAASLALCS